MTKALLTDIDAFLEKHGVTPVSFGRQAMRDPHFVRDLRAGRRVWPETEQRVRSFMTAFRSQPDQVAA
ncbi:hypothetical protein [Sphingomonas abaci]|uniref:2,4-dienoyl-CoA reductase-like NADH-dependent reductase (Old Yellow Enzyme family) n=1 Tax=Sphingomonas abaci TaxID=237611 RepID=A0A7W7EZ34_9SPHN|nr:hypothetical protein [Sphingomonas abaci]MBB4618649.1 2,4-dienoyl-CoA reductase-like NADH-dependent reductase (Old Yellow Enzyme family) [Sphingomonas abaci]